MTSDDGDEGRGFSVSSGLNAAACPVCGQSDQSQSIQAIVAGQTQHFSNHGTSLGMGFASGYAVPLAASHRSSSTAQSPLAEMLDLPYPQQPRSKALGAKFIIVSTLFFIWFPVMISSLTQVMIDSVSWLVRLILSSPALIGGIMLIMRRQRDLRMWRREIDLWHQARRVWVTLRYCHRDHVVYQWPDVTISPTMVRQFTYDQIVRQPRVSGPATCIADQHPSPLISD
jgi:hypothetical protein